MESHEPFHYSGVRGCRGDRGHGRIKLELAFQGSKVFEHGGPFTDLYRKGDKEIGQAKRDP